MSDVGRRAYCSNVCSIAEAVESLEDAVGALASVDIDGLSTVERLHTLGRLEASLRRQVAVSTALIGGLEQAEDCPPVPVVLADVLRITRAEARRRVRDAEQLCPRTTLSGQPLPPRLPATAAAWRDGVLDVDHLRTIQKFTRDLPVDIARAEVEKAEAFLVEKAAELRPDQLEKVADRLSITINPDGKFTDTDRALRRGFTWCGVQRPDGMSVGKLVATPELRALLDAWSAKFAAPGMCNPDDQIPTVSGQPSQHAVDGDARGTTQRQHDALVALVRGQLGDPKLGKHNGLPVTVVVSATLDQLQSGAGYALTAGGTLLPMRDLIRMAGHAWHYLCVFDSHTERPLYLGRSKRIASTDQRVVLHAKDRGCTAPGCTIPGYLCEVHHVDEWTDGGLTDIDTLTFACGPHHRLIKPGGWRTRKRADGSTQWLPPPRIPISGGTNTYHHPERMLPDYVVDSDAG